MIKFGQEGGALEDQGMDQTHRLCDAWQTACHIKQPCPYLCTTVSLNKLTVNYKVYYTFTAFTVTFSFALLQTMHTGTGSALFLQHYTGQLSH